MFQWLGLFAGRAHAEEPSAAVVLAPAKYAVGYRVLQVPATDAGGNAFKMDVALWYPTSSKPLEFEYDFGSHQVGATVAPDGQPIKERFPLVIYSHGATGGGLSSFFLTQYLASQGYIVAAPDHSDDYIVVRIDARKIPAQTALYRLGILKYLRELRTVRLDREARDYRPRMSYRPKQVGATIDALLDEQSPVAAQIDSDRTALVGHSLGAWTAMLLGGADKRWADSRVKAIAALSGPVTPRVYENEELAAIKVPVLLMYGTTEVAQGRGNDRTILFDRLQKGPVFMAPIQGADHLTFAAGGRQEYKTVAEFLEQDARRKAIVQYTTSFLDAAVKQDPAAGQFLLRERSGVTHKNTQGFPALSAPAP
jgi:predicted dienelactone hydrolase